jgi:REP element-mobilizing transposase RayT
MARALRIECEDVVYHVTARGNERRKIFFTKLDHEKFLDYIKAAKKKYGILVHSYVLMSNHYHLIIETPNANLSRAMQYINGSYTTYVNTKRKRSGHLFQGRYKAIIVDVDTYLLELSRYIHLNPVRAKMVEKPEDHIYSSYKGFISNKKDGVLTKELLMGMISESGKDSKSKYKAFVERAIGMETESPLKKVYGGIVLGRISFIKETLTRLKREYLQEEEIANRRALRTIYGVEEIIDIVSHHFHIKKDDITENNKPEQRKISLYLIKKHTGATNKAIGEVFGGITYSAVSKQYQRFTKELEGNRKLRKEIHGIERGMSNVKV